MSEKKVRYYHVSLMSSRGEPVPSIRVLADEIKSDYPTKSTTSFLTLLLGGEEVGKFANSHVAGWWTTEA